MTGSALATPLATTAALLLASCQCARIDNEWARRASALEAAVDEDGNFTEIEYHIAPNLVPMAVRGGMSDLYPNATFTRAEYEVHGGEVFYELAAEVDGRTVEAMFREDGRLHALEVEVDPASEPAITRAVLRLWPGAGVTALEEVRDGERLLVEYHVKIDAEGKALKVRVDRDGVVLAAVRETTAEIEVPVALPKG